MRSDISREKSRKVILGRLKIYGQDGALAKVILERPLNTGGPWSEDLQDLIREGLVESLDPQDRRSMTSKVRLTPVM